MTTRTERRSLGAVQERLLTMVGDESIKDKFTAEWAARHNQSGEERWQSLCATQRRH